jgi:hypothetical protein
MQPTLFHSQSAQQWTVSRLTFYIRKLLEENEVLQDVWVQGEISNLSRPASGHVYFTLKDASAALKCVMWKTSAARLGIALQDGMAVEVHGKIGVYEVSGQYQLYADQIRPVGEGALYQEFMRLKAMLEAEGLFAPERKRPIPVFPQTIGIVTSPTGAALRDMLNTLRRRLPLVQVILAPSPVQGVEAPPALVKASRLSITIPDVISWLGGGSIEDLGRSMMNVAGGRHPVCLSFASPHETAHALRFRRGRALDLSPPRQSLPPAHGAGPGADCRTTNPHPFGDAQLCRTKDPARRACIRSFDMSHPTPHQSERQRGRTGAALTLRCFIGFSCNPQSTGWSAGWRR